MSNSILSLPDEDGPGLLDPLVNELRRSFAELAQSAERHLSGRNFIFSRYGKDIYPYIEDMDASQAPGCIIPLKEGRPVASVDSTCVLVGETSEGALYAARTAVGVSFEGAVRKFFRLGPILVYASSAGLTGLGSQLSRAELGMVLSDHAIAERVIRNTLESRVVEALLGSRERMVVMADGSLKHPFGQFNRFLPSRLGEAGCLVGFSKSSNLIFNEAALGSLTHEPRPSYHILEDGDVATLLAKFATDGLVFRLDVACRNDTVESVLGRVLWNDAFSAGYPESLKVAHHLSVFSKADDQAIKAYVTRQFRLRSLPTFTLRTIALGTFKGGA
ncbi:MAG: hypothetical protein HY296_01035 [Thaumarchaeota archaeon]|nr:hypothetical protein [Nitrososphaerota archaeon]